MATLTVLKFTTANGAEQALGALGDMQKEHLITIHDAATVNWEAGQKRPKTRQLNNLAGAGALDGAFWGMLFGLLFFMPFLGLALGAAAGALGGAFRDVGIDDDFIKRVRSEVTPGTSALFLMSSGAVVDRIAERMKAMDFEIIATNLSSNDEEKLREMFAA